MKHISDEIIIRALHCDEYEHAGFISSAASALLSHLENPRGRFSPEILPRSFSAEPEIIKSSARHKKIPSKRLPIIYFPSFVTFPRISFIE